MVSGVSQVLIQKGFVRFSVCRMSRNYKEERNPPTPTMRESFYLRFALAGDNEQGMAGHGCTMFRAA